MRGLQPSSRWESRNRSVASSEMVEPSISIRTPVSTGSMSSRPAAVTAWATACANTSLCDRAGRGRHVGERRVVLDRHRLQAEPGRAAGQRDPGAVEHHLDRLGRQAAADVGEQPAADQGAALVADLGRERGAGRGLVVEGREHQAVVARLDEQAGEDRDAGADREAAGSPGDGIGEDVALDAELHDGVLRVGQDGYGRWRILPCASGRGRFGVVCPVHRGTSRASCPQVGARMDVHGRSISLEVREES